MNYSVSKSKMDEKLPEHRIRVKTATVIYINQSPIKHENKINES